MDNIKEDLKTAFDVTFVYDNKGYIILLVIIAMILFDLIFPLPEDYPGKLIRFGWELPVLVMIFGSIIGFSINFYYAHKYSNKFKRGRRM